MMTSVSVILRNQLFTSVSMLLLLLSCLALRILALSTPKIDITSCPPVSPVSGLKNRMYEWKHGQRIRYQKTEEPPNNEMVPVLLIHGLFVNADHWRNTLISLQNDGVPTYAIDLLGCGWSDKPPRDSPTAQLCNGETKRFVELGQPTILNGVQLGTPEGGSTVRVVDVDLRHPLGSPYNFYTWADQIIDFCQDVILRENPQHQKVALVCNSIGTISSLQAVKDSPDIFAGVFVVCPNFRELHSAEVPYARYTMGVLRFVQRLLCERGQPLFDALAKPDTVKEILRVPYAVQEAVDELLVKVLLDPLVQTDGASNVVFDTLSYSAGPLPEQQLQDFPTDNKPVWVVYGDQDPWTPGPRVEALQRYPAVEKVFALQGVGHCPHDEAPTRIHPLLMNFLERLRRNTVDEKATSDALLDRTTEGTT